MFNNGIDTRFVGLIHILHFIFATLVCINHLPATIFSGIDLPDWLDTYPTIASIIFLAFSCGVLARVTSNLSPNMNHFIVDKFLRLAIPAWFAVIADMIINKFSLPANRDFFSIISLSTLTHTWYYRTIENVSSPIPFAYSNLVWISSVLFGLYIIFYIFNKKIKKLNRKNAFLFQIIFLLAGAAFYILIFIKAPIILEWQKLKFPTNVVGPYEFINWLLAYSPLAEFFPFFCGVFFAIFIEKNPSKSEINGLLFICFAIFLVSLFISDAWQLRFFALSPPLFFVASLVSKRIRELLLFVDIIPTKISYEIFIFHILYFHLSGILLKKLNLNSYYYMILITLLCFIFMIYTLIIFQKLIYITIRSKLDKIFGLSSSDLNI